MRLFVLVFTMALATSALAQAPPTSAPPAASAAKGEIPGRALKMRALENRAVRLERALSQDPRLDVPLSVLFHIDLADEEAVSARIRALRARLAQNPPSLEAHCLVLEQRFLELPHKDRVARLEAETARVLLLDAGASAKDRAQRATEELRKAQEEQTKALEEARTSSSAAIRAIKGQRVSIARAHRALAELDLGLSDRSRAQSKRGVEVLQSVELMGAQVRSARTSSAAAQMYESAQSLLQICVVALDGSLLGLQTLERELASVRLNQALPALSAGTSIELRARDALQRAIEDYDRYAQDIVVRERKARLSAVKAWHHKVGRMIEVRSAVIGPRAQVMTVWLQRPWRARARGASWVQIARDFKLELLQELRLVRSWSYGRGIILWDDVERLRSAPRTFLRIRPLVALFQVVLVLVGALWLRRQGAWLSERLHEFERSRVRGLATLRRLVALEALVSVVGPIVLYILTVQLVRLALGPFAAVPELDLLLTIATWMGYYWLLRRSTSALIVRGVRRRRMRIEMAMKARIEASTLLIGRAALYGGLLRALLMEFTGRGPLTACAELLWAVMLVLVVLVLIGRWRASIVDAYLKVWPEGRLARLVQASRDKSYGFFVVLAAFLYVSARLGVLFVRRSVLRFDQIRKALAFLFRIRAERRAEALGEWEGDPGTLPMPLRRAFTQMPLSSDAVRIDRFPGMDKFKRDLLAWRDGEAKGSFLLHGAKGAGKTTWLNRAQEEIEALEQTPPIDVYRLNLHRAQSTEEGLRGRLAETLSLSEESGEFLEGLTDGAPRVIILDDIHNLFLRRVGGAEALDYLMLLIEATGRKTFWLASSGELSYRYLNRVRDTLVPFRAEQALDRWSEDEIGQLLMARAVASGIVHEFEDLVFDADAADSGDALARASEAYVRLIWDYADGLPLLAVHFWLRSLVPGPKGEVNVRLFKAPEQERLRRIPEKALFLYAALALHENLSVREAAEVLRFPLQFCEAMMIRGHEEGLLSKLPDDGRYTLSVQWYRSILRYLRQKHVL